VEQHWWQTLCSYTRTGYQQIGARLTSEGLGSNYKTEEVEMALTMSSNLSLLTVMQFATLASDWDLMMSLGETVTASVYPTLIYGGPSPRPICLGFCCLQLRGLAEMGLTKSGAREGALTFRASGCKRNREFGAPGRN
jgi:hypothetical protein